MPPPASIPPHPALPQGFFRIVTGEAFDGRDNDYNLAIETSCGWAVPQVRAACLPVGLECAGARQLGGANGGVEQIGAVVLGSPAAVCQLYG